KNLEKNNILNDTASFRWVADIKDYPLKVKAGRYRLEEGMNNRTFVNLLMAGLQEPVKLRFQNIRLKKDFAGFLGTQLEPDSTAFMALLASDSVAQEYGFDEESFFNMFIPNTYEFFWNTSAATFLERMQKEYH